MAKAKTTAEDLNAILPSANEDDVTRTSHSNEYVKATQQTAGVGMGEVLAAAGVGDNVFNQDSKIYDRNSYGEVVATPIGYTDQRKGQMEAFAQANAALECSVVQQHADPGYKEQLKNVAAKAANVPAPEVSTIVEGQRITMSPAVTKVPASFNNQKAREDSLKLFRTMVGHEQTIEVISCARTAGITFVALPMLWLSQQLSVETQKNENYDDIPRDINYLENVEAEATHDLKENIAKLFSQETARRVDMIAKVHRTSTLYVLRYLVDKCCKTRRMQVTPDASGGSEFNDLSPENIRIRVA